MTKSIVDTVNELKGEWQYKDSISAYYRTNGSSGYWYYGESKTFNDEHVCTREEFNQCVEEMESNFGECNMYKVGNYRDALSCGGTQVAKPVTSPVHTKESAAIKTLENLNYTYHGAEYWKPPIGLVNGTAYQFDYCNETHHGVYGENMKRFYHIHGFLSASVCTNIQLLEVQS